MTTLSDRRKKKNYNPLRSQQEIKIQPSQTLKLKCIQRNPLCHLVMQLSSGLASQFLDTTPTATLAVTTIRT